ncbi:progranulin isoform X3 [Struthio camelus]
MGHAASGKGSESALSAMWTFTLLWLALAGAAASLLCPNGQPCPVAPSLPMFSANSVRDSAGTVCQDGSRCPAEYSCLPTISGTFGCCPLAESVSCAGGLHCCPQGSHCSADSKFCFAHPALGAIQCPDGESECPDNSTCCMMPSGAWGCCPMPEASCCADKVHCCPHATICDLAHGRCLTPTGELPLGNKFPAWKRQSQPSAPVALSQVTCPDGQSACPDGTTCCQLPSAQYGCCPLQNAVCCSDHLHCCPQGTTCDLERSKCASGKGWVKLLTRLSTTPTAACDVKCDEEKSCPDGSTCCRLSSGAWGCCPLEQAVCCPDHVHCCPQGYTCDPEGGSCLQGGIRVPWQEKMPARARGREVKCDEEKSCPDGSTCCRLSSGAWGCCPLEQAVCCPDHVHCCPQGYTCDPEGSSCLQGGIRVPWQEKMPARARGREVKCDEEKSCPDGSTCCRLSSGAWGCCPLEQAVCCPDHVHCCPQGYTCDPEGGSCLQGGIRVPWQEKMPARARGREVKCDEEKSCPDGSTCCRLSSGAWGCCPLEQAVCCPDHVHCCPQGYTCDPEGSSCLQGGIRVPWQEKMPARARGREVKCDEEKSCPDGSTCCRLSSGAWGCCPLEQAVCCPDHVHCCPQGYTCDPEGGSCLQGGIRVPWQEKMPARARGREVKCDEEKSCPDGSTCCRLSSGAWGCCPLEQAVCCPDHVHCCPQGYTCDPEGSSCLQGGIRVPWQEKMPARARGREVKCDEEKSCPDGSTCCRLSSGAWGCCPLEQAVCCPDHVHCCPQGYTCDPEGGSCLQGGIRVPWQEKMPARARGREVKCDEEKSCPDGSTCCRLSSGAWGCCPLEQAVCCSDGFHCCPLGYTCDLAQGRCHKEQLVMPWVAKMPATRRGQAVKCNATASCADGQTCCKSQSGDWACCQLPSAVCCKDHQHCCPWGYTCNVVAQSCEKQRAPALTQAPAASPVPLSRASAEPAATTPCDTSHFCRGGQKCCRGQKGSWGCCPFSQGSCCADGRHCCPYGYRCASGTCSQRRPLRWDLAGPSWVLL